MRRRLRTTSIRPSAWSRALYAAGCIFLRALWFPGRLRVRGLENVPKTGAFIYAPNHVSYVDPIVAGLALWPHRVINFMAKAELFRIPLFAPLIRAVRAFPVQRGSGDRDAIRHALALLADGQPVLVFPEGTRAPDDSALLPGELGVALLAARSGAPVIPVGLIGTARIIPRGKPIFVPRTCEVRIGAPLDLPMLRGGSARREQLEAATAAVMSAIAHLTGKPDPGVKTSEPSAARAHPTEVKASSEQS